jgi:DNA-binding Lrp family transcriptional regulator
MRLEISRAAKEHPDLRLRMGIHSGPVSGIVDVTGRPNLAGARLNLAQRVMDCGDAGHILLSRHIGEDLEHYKQWRPHLHDLGECKVKHGARVAVVNLYTKELGNPDMSEKFRKAEVEIVSPDATRGRLTAIVEVFLETDRPKMVNEFQRAIQAAPEVLQAYYVRGDADFILIVTAKDMQDFLGVCLSIPVEKTACKNLPHQRRDASGEMGSYTGREDRSVTAGLHTTADRMAADRCRDALSRGRMA